MPFRSEHIVHFKTLASLHPPRVTRALAIMIVTTIIVTTLILWIVPWVQTAPGTGQVIALDPRDRVQSITAFVGGRVDRWYVQDGSQVKEGDPVARVVDLDPLLLSRLAAERAQVEAEIAAAEQAMKVAQLDVARSRELLGEGLIARRDYELAQIKVAEMRAKIASVSAKLNQIDVSINRQSAQIVRAPRAGRIQQINPAAGATLVKSGDVLATFAAETPDRVIELYVDGRDIALIHPGRNVRIEFEGFPAFQFSGWPTLAQGLFEGRVRSIDPSASVNGLFRILIEQKPGAVRWPDARYIRLGAKVQGWVQMETVPVGYELWRQLNDFPLEFRRPADEPTGSAAKGDATTKSGNAPAY